MQKKYIISLLICLLLSGAATYSTQTTEQKQYESYEGICDDEILTNNDELDDIVDSAIETGVLKDNIEVKKLSKCELFLRKTMVLLVLRPYLYLADRYSRSKDWTIKAYKISKNWMAQKYKLSTTWLGKQIQNVWKKSCKKEKNLSTSEHKQSI